jgi:hypothetical protein
MAKMFYTQEEAQAKLGVAETGLKQLISDNKLREFRDNNKVMFKVDQVDKLASDRVNSGTGGPVSGDSGIDLAPLGGASAGSSMDALSLADSGSNVGKDDTIVTTTPSSNPRSVFKPDEIKSSDTSAQTQIQPALDDQLSLESVGSGSGLLDLTRERDDTSLGAELLEEIYPGGDASKSAGATGMGLGIGSSSGIFEPPASDISGPSGLDNMAAPKAIVGGPEFVEARDPASGAFGGFALAAVLAMLVTFIVTAAAAQGFSPDWASTISSSSTNVLIFGVILLVIALLLAGVGFFVGKATTR